MTKMYLQLLKENISTGGGTLGGSGTKPKVNFSELIWKEGSVRSALHTRGTYCIKS